jgi:hypothetical protein
MIDAIGPANKIWEGASERALTIIPNYFVTGVIAMIVSFIVIIWSTAFIQRKYGGLVLILLSIALLLVGGGIAPIDLAIIAGVVATRINKPLTWWRTHLSVNVRRTLAKLWPWSFIGSLLLFFITLEINIFGWFFGINGLNNLMNIVWTLAYVMLGLFLLTVISGLAHDSLRENAQMM